MADASISAFLRYCEPEWISTSWVDRLARSRDASLYRLVPKAVAWPRHAGDVKTILQACRDIGLHLTFRAAGTSLSGQAITDGILVDLSRHWNRIEILDQGAQVRVQPGITGGRVNAYLARYGRKLGPDPASINAAMIGGIVANNASGMCCGTAQNTYHTMASIRFMLADGTTVDTSDPACDRLLQETRPDLHDGLATLRDQIRSDQDLTERIRRKYRIKNTMGYSLNAFLDEDEPARILGRLMVGSEGTLGFIEHVVYNTVDDPRDKYTALFVYDSIDDACATVDQWRDAGAAAVEIMDDASIRSFSSLPHTPEPYRVYQPGRAALLVEFHGQRPDLPGDWVTQAEHRDQLWRLRKGLMPSVGALRPSGSTMINEDIAVPPEHLADLVRDVQAAFTQHGFDDAIIFGHAKDGNIHFVINQDFAQPGEVDRYLRFMDRIAQIVVDTYGGSLKAEHGTGRNMAPYVEQEWGRTAFELMQRLKTLCDPHGILNPDVLVSTDPQIHVKHLKPVPVIDASVNACIECGFCEHVCPTRAITLTPRQRIVLQRELQADLPNSVRREVEGSTGQYYMDDSCAADGMCATACPVNINTADLVKVHRAANTGTVTEALAAAAARHPQVLDAVARLGATTARMLPRWPKPLGRPDTTPHVTSESPDVLYAPACPSRWFGTDNRGQALSDHVRVLAHMAGLSLHQVDSGSVCCGQIFESKGLATAHAEILDVSRRTLETLPEHLPLVTDVSTCGAAFVEHAAALGRTVLTPTEFLEEWILPRLQFNAKRAHVVVHPGCGVAASGDTARLLRLIGAVSDRVSVPPSAGCCGMAGDHGLRHPKLVDAAVRPELEELAQLGETDAYVSLNPVCQAALSDRSKHHWISVWELVRSAVGD